MNFAEIISDLKNYDEARYYAILKKLNLEETEYAGGGDHHQNIKKNSPTIVEIP